MNKVFIIYKELLYIEKLKINGQMVSPVIANVFISICLYFVKITKNLFNSLKTNVQVRKLKLHFPETLSVPGIT